jgi:hypothetical protein
MPLITISAGVIGAEWHGDTVPTVFRLYANRDFVASDGTFISKGSDRRPDFFQTFEASIVDNQIEIAEGEAYTTTDALNDDGLTTYTGAVYDADGRLLKTLFSNWRIPHDMGSPVNWNIIDAFSQGVRQKRPSTYLSSEVILYLLSSYQFLYQGAINALDAVLRALIDLKQDLLVSGTNIKTINTESLLGSGDLSIAGATAGVKNEIDIVDPADDYVVVQPQLVATKNYRHTSVAGFSIADEITEAAAAPSQTFVLVVDSHEIWTNATHPANLYLDFAKGGTVTVNAGQIVNINPPLNTSNKQIFFGAGQVRIKKHPAVDKIPAVLWLPDATTATQVMTAAMSQALRESQANNYGSTIELPRGHYTIDHKAFTMSHGNLFGVGAPPDALSNRGTILELTVGGQAAIQVMPGANNVKIGRMLVYADDVAVLTAQAVLLTGEAGVDPPINNVEFDDFSAFGFEDQVKCARIGGGNYLFDNIVLNQNCRFINYSSSGFYLDSLNSRIEINTDLFIGKENGTSCQVWLKRRGTVTATGQGRGPNAGAIPPGYSETDLLTVPPSGFNTGTNIVTSTDHPFQTGTHLRATCPAGDDTDLPTYAGTFSFANGRKAWVHRIDADTFTLHSNPSDALSGTSPLDNTAIPTEDVKFWSVQPNSQINAVRPFACFRIGSLGGAAGLCIRDWQDEGMPRFIVVEDYEAVGVDAPFYYEAPITVQHCLTQGQIFLGHSVELIMQGCTLPLDSIHDDYGVAARVRMTGCTPLTYSGVETGGVYKAYNRAGFFPDHPWRFDDFKGFSTLESADEHDRGLVVSRLGNDVPIQTWNSANNAVPFDLNLQLQRLGAATDYPGAWDFRNAYDPEPYVDGARTANPEGDQQFNIIRMASAFINKGFVANEHSQGANAGSGTIILNLAQANHFTGTLVEDATLEVINGPPNAQMLVTFEHVTSGTTGWELTGGTTPDVFMDAFNTGTISGARRTLFFLWDGTRLTEIGRGADAAGATYSVGNRLAANVTTTSDATLNDRLSITLPVGTWEIDIHLIVTAGIGGYKTGLGGTATYTGRYQGHSFTLDNAADTVFSIQSYTTAADEKIWTVEAGVAREIVIRGSIDVTVAGTFILQSAQETSDAANTIEYAGSYIKAVRLS